MSNDNTSHQPFNVPFKRVCVIGAGVMGQGIAAHLANAHCEVVLLDIVPPKHGEGDAPKESKAFRNKFAAGGLQKAKKSKPALFLSKSHAGQVTVGNLEDDLGLLAECDWVVEVIIENLGIKQKLFEKLEGAIKPGTIVTSNTSGLSISGMTEGRGEDFKKNFCVTHFFNPVRYMDLLEIVSGEQTNPAVIDRLCWFGSNVLGKGIVMGKDTPNFVANRIGVFAMMETMRLMMEGGYSLEEVDATFGPAMGRAKSAVFGTADVVGLDTFVHVAQNCYDNLGHDEQHAVFKSPAWLKKMVDEGYLGRKSKKGFYKMEKSKEGKQLFSLDTQKLKDGVLEYRPKEKVRTESLGAVRGIEALDDKIAHLCFAEDKTGLLAWNATMATAVYAANRFGEISDSIMDIDNGVKWGFKYERGPFETWDAIGVEKSVKRWEKEGKSVPDWVKGMLSAGRASFYAFENGQKTVWDPNKKEAVVVEIDAKERSFEVIRQEKTNVVKEWFSASLIDLGDGVLACEFHAKMNALDADIMEALNTGLDMCEAGKFDALVVANDGDNFCVGANIMMIYLAAQAEEWEQLTGAIASFQNTMTRLKYSTVPTVAAPFQMTLGGGCEVAMWCNKIRAHCETYIGLVEVGVGLIPGAGGNIELLARTLKNTPDNPQFPTEAFLQRAFEQIAMAKVATSAEEGRDMLFLSPDDGVTLNRRHLLEAAKQDALHMVKTGWRPPMKRTYRLPGRSAMATFEMVVQSMMEGGFVSAHDKKIAMKVAHVLTGGDTSSRVKVSEQYLLDLEREAFLSLCGEQKTQDRISHMLQKNKPLRN